MKFLMCFYLENLKWMTVRTQYYWKFKTRQTLSLFSTSTWKEVGVRQVVVSYPNQQSVRHKEKVSRHARRGLAWILGKKLSTKRVVKHWKGCPEKGLSHQPWRGLKDVYVWHLGTQFSGGLGSAGLMVGLNLKGLCQPKDSLILWENTERQPLISVICDQQAGAATTCLTLLFPPSLQPRLPWRHKHPFQYSANLTKRKTFLLTSADKEAFKLLK